MPFVNNIAKTVESAFNEVGKLLNHMPHIPNLHNLHLNNTSLHTPQPHIDNKGIPNGHFTNLVNHSQNSNYHNNLPFLRHFNVTSNSKNIAKPFIIPSSIGNSIHFPINQIPRNRFFNTANNHFALAKEQEILNEVHKVEKEIKNISIEEEKMIEKVDKKINNLNSLLEKEHRDNQDLHHKNFVLAALVGGILVAMVFLAICGMFKFFFSKSLSNLNNLNKDKEIN